MDKILIVDDDASMRYSLNRMLEGQGFVVSLAKNGVEALERFDQDKPELVIMDIRMPGQSGLEVLKTLKERDPKALVILMTAFGTTETAIEAMKFGAFDYILKPFDIPQMRSLVERALEVSRMMKKMVSLPDREEGEPGEEVIVGSSAAMQQIYKMIGQVAPAEVTVLLRGESGTGKELVARAIYHHSRRTGQSFLPVNCAAIPETLLESELFGHEKGSFTGALTRRIGKFEQCNGGTIFLDEIGDMTPATQAKVLRVLQDRQFERLGGSERITVDVRLIVATNKDLEKAIREGTFRQDLYYRLKVVSLHLPPPAGEERGYSRTGPLLPPAFLGRYKPRRKRYLSPGARKTHALPLAGKRTGVGEFSEKGHGDHQREHSSPGRLFPGRGGVRSRAHRTPGFG